MDRLKRFIGEVHRRSLWQVLGIYAVGSWVAYEVILALTEGLGLPAWVPGFAVVLILLGLPVVLATAFVQEGLPTRAEPPPPHTWESGIVDPTLFPQAVAADAASEPRPSQQAGAPRGLLERVLTWRRSLTTGVVAFALLGFGTIGWIGLRALGIGPWGSLMAAGVLQHSDRILIADFEGRGGDSALAAVVTEAFRIDFARSTVVRAAEPAQMRVVLRQMERPDATRLDGELAREVAQRAGIGAFVTGEIAAAGGGYVLTARLVAAESGEVLAALRERARDEEDVIGAIDRLSRGMRERTGESLKTIRRAQPLEQVTTASFEALQKYTQAVRATGWDGDAGRGFRLLQEAVELDSAFASAHRAIAIAYSNRDQPELALAAIERALRFQDRLTDIEREQTYGSYHSIRGEMSQSAAAYERALKLDPNHFAALNNLALEHERMFDYVRAESYLRRAIEADTGRFFGYTNLGELLVFAGRFDEARQAFEAAVARAPESGWPVVNVALVPFAAGAYADAEVQLRRLIDDPATGRQIRDRADVRLIHLLLMRGKLVEAERRTETLARASGDPAAIARRMASHRFATSYFILRNVDRAREIARQGRALVGEDADENTLVDIASTCALTGDVACAREHFARAGHTGPPQPWANIGVHLTAGSIAMAEQDFAKAIDNFRNVRDRRCPRCEESFVGQAFERMQQPDSAIAAYERYLAAPSVDRIFVDAYDRGFVHERLGALYEQRNDRANAARHYAQLLALWQDADPQLQPRVAESARRLERLRLDR